MKIKNQELAALICKFEETKDKNILLDMAIKASEIQGVGDPILVQTALNIINEQARR